MKHEDYCYVDVAIGGPSKRNNFVNLTEQSVELPDPPIECYQTAFRYPKAIIEGTAGYRGLHYLDAVYFDFDHGDDHTLDACRESTAAFLEWLQTTYSIPASAIDLWFSGRKGFHVYIPSALFGIQPSTRLASVVRQLVDHLTQRYVEDTNDTRLIEMTDLKVYDRVRLFRLPDSIHGKSKLYKIQLNIEDLGELCAEDIEQQATESSGIIEEMDLEVDTIAELEALYNSFDLKAETKPTDGSDDVKPDYQYGEPCYIRMLEGVGEGERDAVCLRLATFFKKKGMDRAMVETALLQWNEKNTPPLEEWEVQKTVKSAFAVDYDFGCNDGLRKEFCGDQCIRMHKQAENIDEVTSSERIYTDREKAILDNLDESHILSSSDLLDGYSKFVADIDKHRVKLGIKPLDDAMKGVCPGEICTFFGLPQTGKTALLLNMLLYVNDNYDFPVVFFSLEQTAAQITERFIQIITQKSSSEVEYIFRNKPKDRDNLIKMVATRLTNVYIVEKTGLGTLQMEEYIRKLQRITGKKVGCIAIDNLTEMFAYGQNDMMKVSRAMVNLEQLAKDLATPLLLVHHASSKQVDEGEPVYQKHLLSSSNVDRGSTFIVGMWREIQTTNRDILRVALRKNRKGDPVNQLDLKFKLDTLTILDSVKKEEFI